MLRDSYQSVAMHYKTAGHQDMLYDDVIAMAGNDDYADDAVVMGIVIVLLTGD